MSRRTSSGRSANTVDAEVANLMNLKNKSDFTNSLLVLRQRYNDEDLVNKIQEVFTQRHASIVKAAKKFSAAVKAKYAQQKEKGSELKQLRNKTITKPTKTLFYFPSPEVGLGNIHKKT
jgi:hypothetical protein